MQIVIDISKYKWESIQNGMYCGLLDGEMYQAIKNGIVLPENPTNGDMIKALFPQCPTCSLFHDIGFYADETKQKMVVAFPKDWWYSPYKEVSDADIN